MKKRHGRASSVGAKQLISMLILTTLQKAKLGRRHQSLALHPNQNSLFDNVLGESLPSGCITEASFKDGDLIDWVCNAKRPSNFSVLRVVNNNLSVSALLQAAMTQDQHLCVRLSLHT